MDTLDRSPARTTPSKRVENVGYALVAVGYAVMTLGILELADSSTSWSGSPEHGLAAC